MGRAKLEIRRLETSQQRQTTFLKRKAGILKKASELSILCDIDIVLLMFSPTDKPTLFVGNNSKLEDVVAKFAQLTPHERAKRKLESLEALQKTFKKIDHEVCVDEYMGSSSQATEELTGYSRLLHAQLSEMQKRLSNWSDIENIDDIEQIKAMEDSLKQSLNRIKVHKENFEQQQILSLGCTNQFQNGMQIPLVINSEQQPLSMSWINNSDAQQMVLPDETMFSHRDMGCSTSTSLQTFPSYLNTGKQELNAPLQDHGLPELSHVNLRLQQADQFPYHSYDPSFINEENFPPCPEICLQEAHKDLKINNFEPPAPIYHGSTQDWGSTSGACAITVFDGNLHPQQQNGRM